MLPPDDSVEEKRDEPKSTVHVQQNEIGIDAVTFITAVCLRSLLGGGEGMAGLAKDGVGRPLVAEEIGDEEDGDLKGDEGHGFEADHPRSMNSLEVVVIFGRGSDGGVGDEKILIILESRVVDGSEMAGPEIARTPTSLIVLHPQVVEEEGSPRTPVDRVRVVGQTHHRGFDLAADFEMVGFRIRGNKVCYDIAVYRDYEYYSFRGLSTFRAVSESDFFFTN